MTLSNFLRVEISSAKGEAWPVFSHRNHSKLPWLLLSFLLSSPAIAQKAAPKTNATQTTKTAEAPIQYSSIPYISDNRHDPFFNPKHYRINTTQADEEIARGLPPPGIAGTFIAQAALEGIATGNSRRSAIVRGADTRAYFLKEGDRLFDGYLKTIRDDSIIFVRETKMRSGKILTYDITKRLRTP
jgi:hypothetical protein